MSRFPKTAFLFIGPESGQNLWSFDYNMRKSPSSWKAVSPVSWSTPPDQGKETSQVLHTSQVNGDMNHVDHVIGPNETLQSLLERLSLSAHLNLFQVRILYFAKALALVDQNLIVFFCSVPYTTNIFLINLFIDERD